MKTSVLFTLIILLSFKINGQGLKVDPNSHNKFPAIETERLGFAGTFPSSFSLRNFAPTPMIQKGGTCVGWSVAYGALSIMYNINNDIEKTIQKNYSAFDPYYIYSLLKSEQNYVCDTGIYVSQALKLLRQKGTKRMYQPPSLECNSELRGNDLGVAQRYANNYLIDDFYTLDPKISNALNIIKESIFNGFPIIISIYLTESFSNIKSKVESPDLAGLWIRDDNDTAQYGHAMVIVGYDDIKFGGSFELLNSWGSNFGDDGIIWIKYGDFSKYILEFYLIKLFPSQFRKKQCTLGDCQNGFGRIIYLNGDSYEGYFLKGKRNNYGFYYWENGTMFLGHFMDNNFEGVGILVTTSGEIVICYFEGGKLTSSQVVSGFIQSNQDRQFESLVKLLEQIKDEPLENIINTDIEIPPLQN